MLVVLNGSEAEVGVRMPRSAWAIEPREGTEMKQKARGCVTEVGTSGR